MKEIVKEQVSDMFDNFSLVTLFPMPKELLLLILKTYESIGSNLYYKELLKKDGAIYHEQQLLEDTLWVCNYLKLDLSEFRIKQLIKQKSMNRTKEETRALQVYNALNLIQNLSRSNNFYNCSDIFNYLVKIFDKTKVQYDMSPFVTSKFKEQEYTKSHRSFFNHLLDRYELSIRRKIYEPIILSTICFMEISYIKPFTSDEVNKVASMLALYHMLFLNKIDCFYYVSFFKTFEPYLDSINKELTKASIQYPDLPLDFSKVSSLIFQIINDGYTSYTKLLQKTNFNHKAYKSDHLEQIILTEMGTIFTKEDVRNFYPSASSMTITRTLNKLKDQNIIKPLSTGRNAQWIKLKIEEKQENKTNNEE